MCPLGFENEKLYKIMTSVITSHRDGKLKKANDLLQDASTIHLFSTQLINRILSEIPSLFNDTATTPTALKTNVETPRIKTYLNNSTTVTTDYKKRLEWACEHLQKKFFSQNRLPFTIIRVLELAYHPFSYFHSHEFPKYVRSLEKCLYVTISMEQPTNLFAQKQQQQQQQSIDSNAKQIEKFESGSSELKRKRSDNENDEGRKSVKKQNSQRENNKTCEQYSVSTPATPSRSITPSLQKISWISPNQVQKAGPFLKELESIMAINFGYDEDEDEDEDEDDEDEDDDEENEEDEDEEVEEKDNGEVSLIKKQLQKKFKSNSIEMKLRKDIKSSGDVIVEEYEEMEFDEDWSPLSQEEGEEGKDEGSEDDTSSSAEEE